MRTKQRRGYPKIINELAHPESPGFAECCGHYLRQHGILHRRRRHCGSHLKRFVVPHQMRNDVMRTCRDIPLSGQQGVDKTCNLLKTRVFWTDMVRYVGKYIQSYPQCRMRKITRKPTAGFLQSLPVHGPFQSHIFRWVLSVTITTRVLQ